MAISRGDYLHVTTAGGEVVTVRALGGPEPGDRFPVVWVATEDDWDRAQTDGIELRGIPWPTEAIAEMTPAEAKRMA